jgi:insertion element IS1 protein InsB
MCKLAIEPFFSGCETHGPPLAAAYPGVIPFAQHPAISKLARQTNHVERFHCTLRQRVSRLVRSTLSFSKKLSNHIGAIKYFICLRRESYSDDYLTGEAGGDPLFSQW